MGSAAVTSGGPGSLDRPACARGHLLVFHQSLPPTRPKTPAVASGLTSSRQCPHAGKGPPLPAPLFEAEETFPGSPSSTPHPSPPHPHSRRDRAHPPPIPRPACGPRARRTAHCSWPQGSRTLCGACAPTVHVEARPEQTRGPAGWRDAGMATLTTRDNVPCPFFHWDLYLHFGS